MGGQGADIHPVEDNLAGADRGNPQDALERGGFACPIPTDQGHNFVLVHLQGDILQDMAQAVVGIDFFYC